MSACYHVEHTTRYEYATPVVTSQHVACLCPRELPSQHVRHYALQIEPVDVSRSRRTDYFGNIVDQFQILKTHSTLVVRAESVVDVDERAEDLDPGISPVWEDLRLELARRFTSIPPDVAQFVHASPYVPFSDAVEDFALVSFPSGRSLVAGAINLMHRIHERLAFDASATVVTTPLSRVLEANRGVCQDFAHVAIACMRSLGLAARYVSGYLLTDPPPGQPRLKGADASHAWLSVYCPRQGWVDLDPTNDVVVGKRHVTLAWGRDYGDVAPLRGVLLGGAEHKPFVGVTVTPFEDVGTASRRD